MTGAPVDCSCVHIVLARRFQAAADAGTFGARSGRHHNQAGSGYRPTGSATGCASRNSSRDSLGIESCCPFLVAATAVPAPAPASAPIPAPFPPPAIPPISAPSPAPPTTFFVVFPPSPFP